MPDLSTLIAELRAAAEKCDPMPLLVPPSYILPLCDAVERLQAELALARGAMQAQDNREKAAGEKCGVPYESGGADWPDEVAERVLELQSENAKLREWVPHPTDMSGFDCDAARDGVVGGYLLETIAEACEIHGVPMPPHIAEAAALRRQLEPQ